MYSRFSPIVPVQNREEAIDIIAKGRLWRRVAKKRVKCPKGYSIVYFLPDCPWGSTRSSPWRTGTGETGQRHTDGLLGGGIYARFSCFPAAICHQISGMSRPSCSATAITALAAVWR
jgi:hypothetical protein